MEEFVFSLEELNEEEVCEISNIINNAIKRATGKEPEDYSYGVDIHATVESWEEK